MDKKTKKKIDVLNQRIQKLRMQLSGEKKQADDPKEAVRIEQEISAAEAEIANLKAKKPS